MPETALFRKLVLNPDVKDVEAVSGIPGSGRSSFLGRCSWGGCGNDSVAALLRRFRCRLSISREEAARRLGVSASAVASWEGKLRLPSSDPSASFRAAFHLSLSEEALVSSAWASGRLDRFRFLSKANSMRMTGRRRRGLSPRVPEDVKREDARNRARRKRDADALRHAGILLPDGSRCPDFDALLERARAGWPDPRLAGGLAARLVGYADNPPKGRDDNRIRLGLYDPEARRRKTAGRCALLRRLAEMDPSVLAGRKAGAANERKESK